MNDTLQKALKKLRLSGLAQSLDVACHDIQAYPVGESWCLSLHCLLEGNMPLEQAHAISSQLEGRLRDAIPRLNTVVIHTEPAD